MPFFSACDICYRKLKTRYFHLYMQNSPHRGEIRNAEIKEKQNKQNDKPGYVVNDHLSGTVVANSL